MPKPTEKHLEVHRRVARHEKGEPVSIIRGDVEECETHGGWRSNPMVLGGDGG